jgi:hypothetical protein
MNAGYFLSWATLGEVINIVLLVIVLAGQFRIRRGIKRLEVKNRG